MASLTAAIAATNGGGKRPRAFGRTSNVWQYVEAIQERTTPATKFRPEPSALDEADNEDERDDADDAGQPTRLRGDALHPLAADLTSPRLSRTATDLALLPPVKKASIHSSLRKPGAVNSSEILKRLQTLGTSASAPALQTIPMQPTPVAVAPPAAAAPTTSTTEATRLRNDFNAQRGKLYFGCSVAFELFNGHVLTVQSPDGAVGVRALEALQLKRDRAVFTLVDLADVRSASSIRYGDAVWLQLSVGAGDASWEQGGVLGAKVREAPQLKALALAPDAVIRNDAPAPLIVGHPVPVRAYLPKNRDDVDAQVDEIQSRVRNKASKMLGKWIVRSAVQRPHGANAFVYNTDEIYLEQDWFYLGADSDAGLAVLRQLPPAAALKDIAVGEYVVERRGAWRLRLLDSTNGGAGLSLAQQQMEKLLLRAKTQLKQSRSRRAGQSTTYGRKASVVRSGAAFVADWRAQLAAATRACDETYLAAQEERLARLPQSLKSREDHDAQYEQHERPASAASSSSPSSRAASARPSGGKTTTPSSTGETVCALCQSPAVGYNLCCEIHSVMNTLHAEREEATAAQATAKVNHAQTNQRQAPPTPTPTPTPTAAANATAPSASSAVPEKTLAPSPSAPALLMGSGGHDRLLALFSQQDQHLRDVISFKEKAAEAARAAEAQARIGLSPVATHFRDRFKHVDALVQQHTDDVGEHGIGGHFQRLHAELKREETIRRASITRFQPRGQRAKRYLESLRPPRNDNDDDDDEDEDIDVLALLNATAQCPLAFPGDGFDAFGNPLVAPAHAPRLLPTPEELDKLPPVDTPAALALYLQNKHAVAEMLEGFVDLVTTHIRPNVVGAMDAHNRGALVEFLDFTARAASFVCARRVQVRVAQLLHAVAASDVGDFDAFRDEYEKLLDELATAVAFATFFHDKVAATKPKKKGGR